MFIRKIYKCGGSKIVNLPDAFIKAANLKIGDYVTIRLDEKLNLVLSKLIVTKDSKAVLPNQPDKPMQNEQ